jgi:D-alanine-D-alanine ligase
MRQAMSPVPPGRIRVAVVYGGHNSEHSISVISAGSVLAALDPARYEVIPVGITEAGTWLLTAADPSDLQMKGRELPKVLGGVPVVLAPGVSGVGHETDGPRLIALDGGSATEFDVAFPVLHGRFGEDGTIQGLFEMAGVPYVGSGVFASAAAMDKTFAKALLRVAGLAVGDYVVVPAGQPVTLEAVEQLGLPVFVKPARAGSSVGISKVTAWADLPAAVEVARAHDAKVLIEAAVTGREIEVAVLEGGVLEAGSALGGGVGDGAANARPRASLPAEIRFVGSSDWYDFDAKYLDDVCEFDVPAQLDPASCARIQNAAARAFEALDCAGLARVDFFLRGDGTGADDVIVNEVNTMPGFTPISLFPRMWGASGVDYPTLVDGLVQAALRRAYSVS